VLRGRFNLRNGARQAAGVSLGLFIDRQSVSGARIHRVRGALDKLEKWRREALSMELFSAAPTIDIRNELARALTVLAQHLEFNNTSVKIALSDAVGYAKILPMDKVQNGAEAQRFWQWQLSKALNQPASALASAWHDYSDDGANVAYGCSMSQAWLDMIKSACRDAGLTPDVIDLGIHYNFNAWHDSMLNEISGPGVIMALEDHSYGILIWDENRRITTLRGKWRVQEHGTGTHDVTKVLMHTIQAMKRTIPMDEGLTVFAIGPSVALQDIESQLSGRTLCKFKSLEWMNVLQLADGAGWNGAHDGTAAIAAALPR